ncbi:GroES-like protein [Coprinellus micaceus]|uniref:GroES-like protein n=1 Tax=Coprinellus micaceus TaxID=71717 RepID=A0A4Y7TGZ1_COPMI|nr:GroES-like protein [Coprinellus micaceus]
MALPTYQKALLVQEKFGDFTLVDLPVPKPGKDEVLVKIQSSALNPVDWMIQKLGILIKDYPALLGFDIAGDVVGLGEGVTQVEIGDKVFTQGVMGNNNQSGFQQYAIVDVHTLAKIPANLTYDDASTISVGIAAPYIGLYNASPYGLGLVPPLGPENQGKYSGTPILIFGGSTVVGHFAIQLAKLSGFAPIITTASPKHESSLKALGATHVLDRSGPVTEAQVQAITRTSIKYIFDGVSTPETQKQGFEILAPGGKQVVVLHPEAFWEEGKKEDKAAIHVLGGKALPHHYELIKELFRNLTGLLEKGEIRPHNVEVLPNGLNGVVGGLRTAEEGKVSYVKLVVRPQETS